MVYDLVKEAGKEFCVHPRDILGPARFAFVIKPRFAVFMALHKRGMSSCQIGRHMNRDHSSVLHGVRRAQYMMSKNEEYREKVERLINFRPYRVTLPPERDDETHNHHISL